MKFSIFLPTYNRCEMLHDTLRSIEEQTYLNYEVFVVDRGSESPVSEVVNRFSSERFNYVCSSQSRHICDDAESVLDEMTGDVFLFLADDDVLLPYALERVISAFSEFPSVEYFMAGFASYDFIESKLSLARDFTGKLFRFSSRDVCFGYLNSVGIGAKRKFPLPPQSHSSLIFLKRSLIDRTRINQRELFIKSFGDIGYVGALANSGDMLFFDYPLGVIGAGHVRETDGIRDRFKHANEMIYFEHVPSKGVSSFGNTVVDGHLKVLYRNRLDDEFPPYIRPSRHYKMLREIMMDRPFRLRSCYDALAVMKSYVSSIFGGCRALGRTPEYNGNNYEILNWGECHPVNKEDFLIEGTLLEASKRLYTNLK